LRLLAVGGGGEELRDEAELGGFVGCAEFAHRGGEAVEQTSFRPSTLQTTAVILRRRRGCEPGVTRTTRAAGTHRRSHMSRESAVDTDYQPFR